MIEVKEILRLWLDGRSLRDVSRVVGGGPQNGPPLCGVRWVAADQAEQFYARPASELFG